MESAVKLYRADLVTAKEPGRLDCLPGGYVAVGADGRVTGVYAKLPADLAALPVEDLGHRLLIPAFTDLHLHSSQLPTAGLGYDGSGAEWFTRYTRPVEERYADLAYADEINRELVKKLWENGSLHSVIMATTNAAATRNLLERLMKSGLCALAGKMNSDFGVYGDATEQTDVSCRETRELIDWARGRSDRVGYVLSPEYVPAATPELLRFLGECARQENLPVQSHMGEGENDTGVVRRRFPREQTYAAVLEEYGLFGRTPTVMAHCAATTEAEFAAMARCHVTVAYCPHSSVEIPGKTFLSVRRCLEMGVPVGLGSDVGGGHTFSMLQNMVCAVQMSKALVHDKPLSCADAFYLATKGGGSFFGATGSFEPGYWFDALLLDDAELNRFLPYTLEERLQRVIYCGDSRNILRRWCRGEVLCCPDT